MTVKLYAMRLYVDDPALIFRAQRQLVLWSARYLAHMLRPSAVAIVPLLVLFLQLDNVYGRRPLAPGESAIVTVQFSGGADLRKLAATLEGQGGRNTGRAHTRSAPGLLARARCHGRIRRRAAACAGAAIAKAVQCGDGPRYISAARWDGSPSIDVSCPAATMDVFGFGIHWPVWFLLVSLFTMLVLRKRFGVVL